MKKLTIVIVMCLLLTLMIPCVHAAGSAYISGPDTVRAGDTITVSFVAGGGIYGGSGTLSYDSTLFTLQGCSQVIGGSWVVEFNGNHFVFYDNNMNAPIADSATIFRATFTVNSDLAEGTNISVSATGVTLSDGAADTVVGTCTYSATIAPPLSSNCQLAALTVSNATISPAFSADVTEYSASVPFSTSSLQVSATAADGKAKVDMSGTSLYAGTTTDVRVTVTAENGAVKEYVIHVTRAADPNYVKSSNADLKTLSVEGFILSPVFDAAVTQYYVWLPYEQTSIAVDADTDDSKASVTVNNVDELTPAKATDITVCVTAEDGTTKVYTISAFRAPAHEDTDAFLNGEREPEPEPEPETEPPTEPATEPSTEALTEPEPTNPPAVVQPQTPADKPVVLIVTSCICLVLGVGIGLLAYLLIGKKRK